MDREFFYAVLFVITMLILILAVAACAAAVGCHSKWGDAGYEAVRYDFPGGCKVKKNGRWFPTTAIRDVQP